MKNNTDTNKNTDKNTAPAKKTQLQEITEQMKQEEAQAAAAAANAEATDKNNACGVQNSPLYKMGQEVAEMMRQQNKATIAELAAKFQTAAENTDEEEKKIIQIADKQGLDAVTLIHDDMIDNPDHYFDVPDAIYSGQDVEKIIEKTEKIVLESTVHDFVRAFLHTNCDSSAAKDVFKVAAQFFDYEERKNDKRKRTDEICSALIGMDIPSKILVKVLNRIKAIPC